MRERDDETKRPEKRETKLNPKLYTVVFKGGKPPLFYTKIRVHPFLYHLLKNHLKWCIITPP